MGGIVKHDERKQIKTLRPDQRILILFLSDINDENFLPPIADQSNSRHSQWFDTGFDS